MDIYLTKNIDELKGQFFKLETRRDVADLLEVSDKTLIYHLYRIKDSEKYTTFTIPKKSGGAREISSPSTNLKILQQKLNYILKHIYKQKFYVHGFVLDKSILTNAKQHFKRENVFNIDLLDFFPSINFGRVYGMFQAKPYLLNKKVAAVLAKMCCYDGKLPQGAPTSPIISNMICVKMDDELFRFARKLNCRYSRYADDITFSTDRTKFPEEIAQEVQGQQQFPKIKVGEKLEKIIEKNGFHINQNKIWLKHRSHRQQVTGLTVNEFPNISRKYQNQIRAMLHAWEKYGLQAAEKDFLQKYNSKKRWPFDKGTLFKKVLRGKINFLKMIKGDQCAIYQKFCEKLSILDESFKFIRKIRDTDPEKLQQAVFVLDNPRGQGTAFMLFGVGLITSAHNVENDKLDTFLYKPDASSDKQKIKIIHINPKYDVAIIDVDKGWAKASLVKCDRIDLKRGEPVKVIGFPKHAPGKTLQIHEGNVTGFGYWFGNKTINIDARIIEGNSGGPVLNSQNEVIGIAFYGASCPEEADRNESGVIPINMVNVLLNHKS